jgi:hypothetical protein
MEMEEHNRCNEESPASLTIAVLKSKERGNDAQTALLHVHVGLHSRVSHDGRRALPRRPRGHFYQLLPLRGRGELGTGILVASAPVNGDDLVAIHARLAHGTGAALVLHLKPSVEARPAIEVSAERHHGLRRELRGEERASGERQWAAREASVDEMTSTLQGNSRSRGASGRETGVTHIVANVAAEEHLFVALGLRFLLYFHF